MSSPLYMGKFVAKNGAKVDLRLTIIHPDVSVFGADRTFAWKLLSDWVWTEDDGEVDDDVAAMARKYIRKVDVSAPVNGVVDERGKGFFTVTRKGKKDPSVVYSIEVSEPDLLKDIKVGDSDEVYEFVEPDKVISDDEPTAAAKPAVGVRRFEMVEGGTSKFWQAHVDGSNIQVAWGRIGTAGQAQEKSLASAEKAQHEFDKLVAEKIKKGYTEVPSSGPPVQSVSLPTKSVAGVAAAKAEPSRTKAPKTKTEPAPVAQKTLEDFRDATFPMLHKGNSWSEQMAQFIVGWSRSADDAQTIAWLEKLPNPEQGWLSLGAAWVAIDRHRAGRLESATTFLRVAEKAQPTASDGYGSYNALRGLVPAWWRLGEMAKGDHGLAALRKDPDTVDATANNLMIGLAGLGGRSDLVLAAQSKLFSSGDYGAAPLVDAVIALDADGAIDAVDAIATRWEKVASSNWELSRRLLEDVIRRKKPGRYLELAFLFPKLLSRSTHAELALIELSDRDPSEAVRVAEAVAQDDFYDDTRMRAVTILTAHDRKKSAAWVKSKTGARILSDELRSFPYLAALGREDEARAGVSVIARTKDRYAVSSLRSLAMFTTDPTTAIAAFKAYVQHPTVEFGKYLDVYLHLVDLGERAFVDGLLMKELAAIEKKSPKERDLDCRRLTQAACLVGRVDLALQALKLPTKSMRRYSAGDGVRGCANAGDWTGALTMLEFVPDDDANGRVSTAVQSGLREENESATLGPRARPPRASAKA